MGDILKNYQLIHRPEDTEVIANTLDRYPLFSLDLETTGLSYKKDRVHGVSLATHDQEWYVCKQALIPMMEKLRPLCQQKLVVGQNLIFDMHFLLRYGVRPTTVFDTMIAQFLIDENQMLGLKELAPLKLGIEEHLPDFDDLRRDTKKLLGRKRLDDVNVSDFPLQKLARYAARDARLTLDLMKLSEYELAKEGMTDIFNQVEMPFLQVLLDLEETGFYVDKAALLELEVEFTQKRDDALALFKELSGVENPNSSQQIAAYFYETLNLPPSVYTDTGKPSVDILALTRLRQDDKNGSVSALLDYRKYEKLIGTYVNNIRENLIDGFVFSHFRQTGTKTGRLSSGDPLNFQNFPVKGDEGKKVRSMFVAMSDYLFWAIDYSQIELRLLAHYTKDPNLLRVFAEGGDPHQMTADFINSMGFAITRSNAKQVNFGWAYRIGPRGLCDTIEKVSGSRPKEGDARTWLDGFGKAYPGAPKWGNRVVDYARQLGYVKTIGGRKRHLPDLTSPDKALRNYAERQAVNAIIQGSVADIMKYSMIGIGKIQGQYDARMNAQVHDEITGMAAEAGAEEFVGKAGEIMLSAQGHFNIRVKLEATPGVGVSWASAKN